MCEYFSRSKQQYYSKKIFRNKAVSEGAISFYLDHFVRTRVSKITYGAFLDPIFNPSDSGHRSRSHNVFICDSGEARIRDFFGIILPKVSCLIIIFLKYGIKKFAFVEYPNFRDKGIQKIFSPGFTL